MPEHVSHTALTAEQVSSDPKILRALYRGDTFTETFVALDDTGAPFDLTDWTPTAQARLERAQDAGGTPKVAFVCSKGSPESAGEITYTSTSDQSRAIQDEVLVFDVRITNDTTGVVATLRYGPLRLYGHVTDESTAEDAAVLPAPDPQAFDAIENVYSAGSAQPAEDEIGMVAGITEDASGRTAEVLSIAGQFGTETERVGNSVRVRLKPTLHVPMRGMSVRKYAPVLRGGSRRSCGQMVGGDVAYVPTHITDNHELSESGRWGFPYGLWTAYDYYLFPHNRHKRLRSDSLGADTGVIGYEYGHRVEAGDGTLGRKLVWDVSGACANAGYTDAFWDWCLDVNPSCVAGAYVTTNRMRMVSEVLPVWTGETRFEAHIELEFLTGTTHRYSGEFTIYDTNGVVLRSWKRSGTGTFAWMTTDAKVQLRWRCDKDLTRLDVFTGQYQGDTNQGANTLRIHPERYELRFVGFEE